MKNIIDWASERARMVLFFVVLSLIAGFYSYFNLPKEGEPDIEIPVVFISVPFQGISAEDSEALLVKPLEKELSDANPTDLSVNKKLMINPPIWKNMVQDEYERFNGNAAKLQSLL